MVGLKIIKNNESDKFLYNFFKGVNFKKYKWVIDYEEILSDKDEKFFEKNILDGQEFFKCITNLNYYMIFLDLKIYKIENEITKIETYDDYLNSDCEMIFLCFDSQFINFYCKDKNILETLYKNCINYNYNVSQITELNNCRQKMSVF